MSETIQRTVFETSSWLCFTRPLSPASHIAHLTLLRCSEPPVGLSLNVSGSHSVASGPPSTVLGTAAVVTFIISVVSEQIRPPSLVYPLHILDSQTLHPPCAKILPLQTRTVECSTDCGESRQARLSQGTLYRAERRSTHIQKFT